MVAKSSWAGPMTREMSDIDVNAFEAVSGGNPLSFASIKKPANRNIGAKVAGIEAADVRYFQKTGRNDPLITFTNVTIQRKSLAKFSSRSLSDCRRRIKLST